MKNIFKFMSGSIGAILIILMLLIMQAYCDLALPSYTSDILNVGLQQGGIENAALETIRKSSMEDLSLFMSEEDEKFFREAYEDSDADDIYELKKGIDREKLSSILLIPETIMLQMNSSEDGIKAIAMIQAALQNGAMTKAELMESMKERLDGMKNMTEIYLNQIAVSYVKAEYSLQGKDLDSIRNAYLWKVGGMMLLMSLGMTVASILTGLIAALVSGCIGRDLRERIYSKVLSFTGAEMEKFSTASLITRATNDVQQIQMVVVMLLRMVAYAPILAIGGILKVIDTKSGMSWIIVLAVIVLAALVGILMAIAMPKFKKMQTLVDRLNRVSREILTGIMPIRAFSREQHEEKRFEAANTELYKTQLFTNRTMTFMMPIMMFVMNGISVLIVWIGAHKVDDGTIQVGDMTAFITYSMVIVMGFLMIAMIAIMLPRAGVAADRIVEVLNTNVSLTDSDSPVEIKDVQGIVEFNDVTFAYPGAEEPVIEHISFKAEPGKTTAIIGSTGCGKSTLVNLIPRFYDVTEGSITLDGTDIRKITQHDLRNSIGYVPQKGILFSGTIESNLKYSGEQVTDEDMIEAAKIAQAEEFIDAKTEKYEAPISQDGSNVSGGQRQRLSIARAIAKHPKVFIFDDSFSALDFKTDLALRKALAEKTGYATVIIVAQRISTILHADQILVLDEGRLVGKGTHEELLENCSTYKEIAVSQLSPAELEGKGGAVNG